VAQTHESGGGLCAGRCNTLGGGLRPEAACGFYMVVWCGVVVVEKVTM